MTDPPAPTPPGSGRPGVPAAQPLGAAVAALQGRLLLQSIPRQVGWMGAQLDPVRSGLVVSGPRALAKVRQLRESGVFTGLLLADPAVYAAQPAGADEPFPTEGQLAFGDPLGNVVEEQLAHGASVALSPTGHLRDGDSGALLAAARRIADLDDPRVVFAVPVDVGWLRDDAVQQLIAVLQLVPGAKALMLGGQLDPLGHFPAAVTNLVRLLGEVPHAALLRTDLAAFGALVNGAAFTAFGTTGGLRHIVPPPQPARARGGGGPGSPPVLVEELMAFFLGRKIANRFAAAQAPTCYCAACGGRPLDTFAAPSEQVPAAAHNAAVLMGWLRKIDAVDASRRADWWRSRCRQAMDRYDVVNTALRQPAAFVPPPQLARWADRPATTPQSADAPPAG